MIEYKFKLDYTTFIEQKEQGRKRQKMHGEETKIKRNVSHEYTENPNNAASFGLDNGGLFQTIIINVWHSYTAAI